jgi:signal transduction histidine kinase
MNRPVLKLLHNTAVARSLVLLSVAALLPIFVFAAVSALANLRQQRAVLERDATGRAQRLSELVDRELAAQLHLIQALSQLPLLDGAGDLAAFAETARRIQQQQPLWISLNLADPQGNRVVDTLEGRGGSLGPVVEMASLTRTVTTRSPLIGNVSTGPLGNSAFAIRAPVVRNGSVSYVLSAAIRPDAIRELLLDSNVPAGWIGAVIDGAGQIVSRTGQGPAGIAAQAARPPGEGVYTERSPEGTETVFAYRASPTTGWSVHIGIPRDVFRGPLDRLIWLTVAGAAFCLLLASLFVTLLVRELRLRRNEGAALEQAGRMEALGRLTGGVAHDFNNLLTIILGNLDLLELRAPDAAAARPIGVIRAAADRAAAVVRELLLFARGGPAVSNLIDINERVRGCREILHGSLGAAIAIELDLAADLPPVAADPIQLDLAMLNLAVNARDAMPDGGTLRIRTAAIPFPDRSRRSGVALEVSDDGSGIPEQALPHVFEPFFTTKGAGKGTGLGLAQVYGFAKHAGGAATVSSKLGRGTTITILLPDGRTRPHGATGP